VPEGNEQGLELSMCFCIYSFHRLAEGRGMNAYSVKQQSAGFLSMPYYY
jgi:hypothetical protein